MKIAALVAASLIFLPQCFAQTKTAVPHTSVDPDRLGQTCPQILKMGSGDWVAYFDQKSGQVVTPDSSGAIRALAVYGKCYDERTKRLPAPLRNKREGGLAGANGNFRDFQTAPQDLPTKGFAP